MPGLYGASTLSLQRSRERPGSRRPGERAALRLQLRRRQVRRRDQHAKCLTPDDHTRIVVEVDAGGDGITLASFEGAQAPEIDVLYTLKIGRGADRGLRYEIDMEGRPRPHLEVVLEEHEALIHADAALAPMDRIGRIGMDEGAGRHERVLADGDRVGGGRRREYERKGEEAAGAPQTGSELRSDCKDDESAPKLAHESLPAIAAATIRNNPIYACVSGNVTRIGRQFSLRSAAAAP